MKAELRADGSIVLVVTPSHPRYADLCRLIDSQRGAPRQPDEEIPLERWIRHENEDGVPQGLRF